MEGVELCACVTIILYTTHSLYLLSKEHHLQTVELTTSILLDVIKILQ